MNQTVSLPITLKGEHWTVSAVSLNAFTDDIDTPVHRDEYHYFRGMVAERVEGNLFFLENEHDGDAYVILTDCPDYERALLTVKDCTVTVDAGTNKVTAVSCNIGECEAVCRKVYRKRMRDALPVAMSNTWGDCNGFSRVCEDFVLKEIDKAAELGLGIVQIDDGWQMGSTYDPSRRDERGRRVFDDDFWVLNEARFPRGIGYISEYAAKKGVVTGLWFAPESRDNFVCMERDIAILKNAYDNWGIRFFKLDMYWITGDAERDRFLDYLSHIYAFGDDVAVQLDVTRYSRINYLCGREFGTIFAENRYTKTRTYYPHRTLKNLWLLSRYIPASKFQFELVNPALNIDSYPADDEFATPKYDIRYLFASVMLSNPLFWMELQFLSEEDSAALKEMLDLWSRYRSVFGKGDVAPIGDRPSGRSFTGFFIDDGGEKYALLFREVTKKSVGTYFVPYDGDRAEILASNASVTATARGGVLRADFSEPRAFAFVKLG